MKYKNMKRDLRALVGKSKKEAMMTGGGKCEELVLEEPMKRLLQVIELSANGNVSHFDDDNSVPASVAITTIPKNNVLANDSGEEQEMVIETLEIDEEINLSDCEQLNELENAALSYYASNDSHSVVDDADEPNAEAIANVVNEAGSNAENQSSAEANANVVVNDMDAIPSTSEQTLPRRKVTPIRRQLKTEMKAEEASMKIK